MKKNKVMKMRTKLIVVDVEEDDGMWLDKSTCTYYSKNELEPIVEPKGLDELARKYSEEQYPPEYETPDDNWKQRAEYIKGFKVGYMKGAVDKEEKIINKGAEWIKKNVTFMHPRKEREVCMEFKDGMKEE